MCGLGFTKSLKDKPINEIAASSYQAQKGRGLNGFGFVEIDDNRITTNRFTEEKDFLEELKKSESKEILWHHRAPTSTGNTIKTNHPIASVGCYDFNYYFVHNGVIRNEDELKKEHEEKFNSRYVTGEFNKFNDSEALMHELILIIEGKKETKDWNVKGSLAFIMLQADKFNKPIALFYGRNTNPLTKTEKEDFIELKSVGGDSEIEVNKIFRFDYDKKDTTSFDVDMGGIVIPDKIDYRTWPPSSGINHSIDRTKQTVIELPGSTSSSGRSVRTWTEDKKHSEQYRQIAIGGIMNFTRISYFTLQQLSNQELSMLLYMSRNILNNQQTELERMVILDDQIRAITIDAQILILNDNLDIIERLLDKK